MKYEPPLDGVRAIAILAVLAYHCFPESLPGGFTGVDVFFVLSGYLITSVILNDVREGSFSLREFYLRRIQRLLPNAVVTVAVTVALSFILLVPSDAVKTARHGLWTLLNLSNVFVWRQIGGYWGDSSAFSPLLHTWSLAVEEQFYLLFPTTLWFLSRRGISRIVGITVLLTVGSYALALYGTWNYAGATFYLLPTRAWEPLLGAVLAAFRVPGVQGESARGFGPAPLTEMVGWAGLTAIVASSFLITEHLPFPGLIALVPTLGAAAVIVSVADGDSAIARLLSAPSLTLIGRMSYSIYLWHWPGIVFGRYVAEFGGYPRRAGELIGAAVGLALSAIAYQYVEKPLRRRGPGRRRRLLILVTSLGTCAAATIVLSIRPTSPDPRDVFDRPVYAGARYDVVGDGNSRKLLSVTKYADLDVPVSASHASDLWRTGGVIQGWGGARLAWSSLEVPTPSCSDRPLKRHAGSWAFR